MEDLILAAWGGVIAFVGMLLSAFAGGAGTLIVLGGLLEMYDAAYIDMLTVTRIAAFVVVLTSGVVHFKSARKLYWKLILAMMIGGIVGMSIGTYLVQFAFNEDFLTMLVPFLLLGMTVYLFLNRKKGSEDNLDARFTPWNLLETAFVFATINVVNGITGGMGLLFNTYTVVRWRMSFIQATAHGMISGVLVHGTQAAYLSSIRPVDWQLVAFIVLGSFLAGIVGTKLSYLKGNVWVRRVAITVMFLMGMQMLL